MNTCDNTELLKAFPAEHVQQDVRRNQYEEWFRSKVARGLTELREGKGLSDEQAYAQIAVFKASLENA